MSTDARPVTVTAETAVKAAVSNGAPSRPRRRGAQAEQERADQDRRGEADDDDARGVEGSAARASGEPARHGAQTLSSPTVLPPDEPEPALAGFSAALPSPPEEPFEEASPDPAAPGSSPAPRRLLP